MGGSCHKRNCPSWQGLGWSSVSWMRRDTCNSVCPRLKQNNKQGFSSTIDKAAKISYLVSAPSLRLSVMLLRDSFMSPTVLALMLQHPALPNLLNLSWLLQLSLRKKIARKKHCQFQPLKLIASDIVLCIFDTDAIESSTWQLRNELNTETSAKALLKELFWGFVKKINSYLCFAKGMSWQPDVQIHRWSLRPLKLRKKIGTFWSHCAGG